MISFAPNLKKHCVPANSRVCGVRYPVLSQSQRDVSRRLYSTQFTHPRQEKPSVFIVTGEPGCGKSTVLTYLTTRLAPISGDSQHPPAPMATPVFLTVPVRGANGRAITPHQILRTILEPYVPWSKTNGYDHHGLLRLLAGVVLEGYPRPTHFVLDVPATISERELDTVTQIVADLREVQHAVDTDRDQDRDGGRDRDRTPSCSILIACTPAVLLALQSVLGATTESVTTFTLETPTVQEVKLAVEQDLAHRPVSRADDREHSAALITAYTHNIHALGLHPLNQSTFETARQMTHRIIETISSRDRNCTRTAPTDAIKAAATSLVYDYLAPPWIPILTYIFPRYQNHYEYIATYDTDRKWDLNNIWFDIPQSLLTQTNTRPPGLLVRHPTHPTQFTVNAPEPLVLWLTAILAQPQPHPKPTPIKNHAIVRTNPYTTCTPNTVAYLAALHTTHRKKPEAFDLTHNEVYTEYIHICKKIDADPKPLRKIYRADKRLSTQGFVATTRMSHTRGRPSRAATMLSPHQLAQLRATMHTLTHPDISPPSDTEISTLKTTIEAICKSTPAQYRILNAILALMQKTKKRVLNIVDIYATYSAAVASPISQATFYATLSRLLKISQSHITSIATATIAINILATTTTTNPPDPPPP